METSNQKMYQDKKFLELNFRVGQFYAKNPKSKITKYPQIWGALGPRGGLRSKVSYYKMFLEFN